MDAAKMTQVEAEELKRKYEEKNNNIDAEIAARKNEARIVIEQSRQQMLHEVQTQIEQLQTQTEDALARLQVKAVQQHKEQLGDLAAEFARGILSDVMTPDLKRFINRNFSTKSKNWISLLMQKERHPGRSHSLKLLQHLNLQNLFKTNYPG
jgi:F0F1-type ATP synthase membrane subunit b/b'